MRKRSFSRLEAGGTLLLVQRIVRDIVCDYRKLSERAERYRASGGAARGEDAPGIDELRRDRALLKIEMGELSDGIDGYLGELQEIGCEVKDLRSGTVDFPTFIDGRPVRFCWRLGEDRVEHWHDTTESCEARKLLTASLSRG